MPIIVFCNRCGKRMRGDWYRITAYHDGEGYPRSALGNEDVYLCEQCYGRFSVEHHFKSKSREARMETEEL